MPWFKPRKLKHAPTFSRLPNVADFFGLKPNQNGKAPMSYLTSRHIGDFGPPQ
jgi:hypothetical protein